MRTLRRHCIGRLRSSLQPFTDNCASEMGTIEACNYEEQLGETIRAAKATVSEPAADFYFDSHLRWLCFGSSES